MDTNPILANPSDQLQIAFQSPPPSLPPYGFPVQPPGPQDADVTTPPTAPAGSKKRKLSNYGSIKGEGDEDEAEGENGSGRKSRSAGTKRACNQCRQQKLKCNVQENPWKACDRCTKHTLECVITADFKRVGKRSQQAELERSNEELKQQVFELQRRLAESGGSVGLGYEQHLRAQLDERNVPVFAAPSPAHNDDGSHDAALLLNLKQSDPHRGATPVGRATPLAGAQKLGDVMITTTDIEMLWGIYFAHYHPFLPILSLRTDSPEHVFKRSEFLFWTVLVVAARHFTSDPSLFPRLQAVYEEYVKDQITKPPVKDQHHAVKALCLLCSWPLPVASTTDDMTLIHSGIMMKFAMQLGIHRPSSPADFNNIPVQLRQDQVVDRLRTWAFCNLVAQHVSTCYGQPPETLWDSTLTPKAGDVPPALQDIEKRLRIEREVDKITRSIYLDEMTPETVAEVKKHFNESTLEMGVEESSVENLYHCAAQLHLDLQVFFEDHTTPSYTMALQQLDTSTRKFLQAASMYDLQFAPNYIMQLCIAAVVALLKLLNSFFGFSEFVDRETGVELFWRSINHIRTMSVRQNDLPQRLAEVFAQMWNAWDTLNANVGAIAESVTNGEIDASLTLKRRYRMSMSHVFDSVWRWKEELNGERDQLKEAVKNPTSPIAVTHRSSSFSNGRRPSSSLLDDAQPGAGVGVDGPPPGPQPASITGFGGFGNMQMAGPGDLSHATSYNFFDPMGWFLNNDGNTGMPDAFNSGSPWQ